MYRTVLSVVLAVALLGASYPAIDDARRDHTDSTVRTELDAVDRAADRLLSSDDAVAGEGARRVVSLRFPAKSWTDAGVERVTVASATDGPGAKLQWTVIGGRQHQRRLPNVPLETPDGEPVTFEGPGRYQLILSLDGTPSDPVVTARRFKADDGASAVHATVVTRGD